jgi:hypothetical protein
MANNYPNPLDRFRSYSYHFVLTASSTTEAFRKMVGNEGRALFSAISSKSLGDEFTVGGETGYLIVDTRRFSQYTITDVEMEHIYGTGSVSNPTVPTSEMRVKLLDSTGLSFFDFMMDLFRNKIKSSYASSFFLLSIIFTGHRDDGTTETISTCHIPLILLLMSFSFTHKGSEFDIEFMEIEGAGRRGSMSQLNYLGGITSVSSQKNGANTVGELIDDLENKLNEQSLHFYQKYINQSLKSAGGDALKLGKLVQYMITVPSDPKNNWRQFKVNTANRSANQEQQFITTTAVPPPKQPTAAAPATSNTESTYSTVSFARTTPISDVIKMILETSTEYLELASQKRRSEGNAIAAKIITSITSDQTTYVVHFDVYPHFIPKEQANSNTIKPGSSTKMVVGATSQIKNLITYDYIYTGKNSHILDMKIQYGPESAVALNSSVELGGARFNKIAENAGQVAGKVKTESTGAAKTVDSMPLIRPGDPIFIPIATKEEMNSNSSQKNEYMGNDKATEAFKAKQEYHQTYAMLHFVSSIDMDITIRGNPDIIRKYADRSARGGFQPHDRIISAQQLNEFVGKGQETADVNFVKSVQAGIQSSKQNYIKNFVQPRISAVDKSTPGDTIINNVDVSVSPMFVKINILAPDVNWTGEFKDKNSMFTNKFFYDGPFMALFIKTSFSGGEFKHSLNLIPYTTDSLFTNIDNPNKQDKKTA